MVHCTPFVLYVNQMWRCPATSQTQLRPRRKTPHDDGYDHTFKTGEMRRIVHPKSVLIPEMPATEGHGMHPIP